jgi:hypothetical protein
LLKLAYMRGDTIQLDGRSVYAAEGTIKLNSDEAFGMLGINKATSSNEIVITNSTYQYVPQIRHMISKSISEIKGGNGIGNTSSYHAFDVAPDVVVRMEMRNANDSFSVNAFGAYMKPGDSIHGIKGDTLQLDGRKFTGLDETGTYLLTITLEGLTWDLKGGHGKILDYSILNFSRQIKSVKSDVASVFQYLEGSKFSASKVTYSELIRDLNGNTFTKGDPIFTNPVVTLGMSAIDAKGQAKIYPLENTNNLIFEDGALVAWFKEAKALPGHPLGIDKKGNQVSNFKTDVDRTHVGLSRINIDKNIWEMNPEKGYQLPLDIIIGEKDFDVSAATALLRGGTFTYKDLGKGNPIKIGSEAYVPLRDGSPIVKIGSEGMMEISAGLMDSVTFRNGLNQAKTRGAALENKQQGWHWGIPAIRKMLSENKALMHSFVDTMEGASKSLDKIDSAIKDGNLPLGGWKQLNLEGRFMVENFQEAPSRYKTLVQMRGYSGLLTVDLPIMALTAGGSYVVSLLKAGATGVLVAANGTKITVNAFNTANVLRSANLVRNVGIATVASPAIGAAVTKVRGGEYTSEDAKMSALQGAAFATTASSIISAIEPFITTSFLANSKVLSNTVSGSKVLQKIGNAVTFGKVSSTAARQAIGAATITVATGSAGAAVYPAFTKEGYTAENIVKGGLGGAALPWLAYGAYRFQNVIPQGMKTVGTKVIAPVFRKAGLSNLANVAVTHPYPTTFASYYAASTVYASVHAGMASSDYKPNSVRISLLHNIMSAGGRQIISALPNSSLSSYVKELDRRETEFILQSFNRVGSVGVVPSYVFGFSKFYLSSPGLALNTIAHPLNTAKDFAGMIKLTIDLTKGISTDLAPANAAEWSYLFGGLVGAGKGLKDVGVGVQGIARSKYLKNGFVILGKEGRNISAVGGNLTRFGEVLNFTGTTLATTSNYLYVNAGLSLAAPLLGSGGNFEALAKSAKNLAYNLDTVISSSIGMNAAFRLLGLVAQKGTSLYLNKTPFGRWAAQGKWTLDKPYFVRPQIAGLGVSSVGAGMYYLGVNAESLKGKTPGNIIANLGLILFGSGLSYTLHGYNSMVGKITVKNISDLKKWRTIGSGVIGAELFVLGTKTIILHFGLSVECWLWEVWLIL